MVKVDSPPTVFITIIIFQVDVGDILQFDSLLEPCKYRAMADYEKVRGIGNEDARIVGIGRDYPIFNDPRGFRRAYTSRYAICLSEVRVRCDCNCIILGACFIHMIPPSIKFEDIGFLTANGTS
ncbi:MAG: hypothetical protein RBG13Loki_1281 [Promethearchaeota archaeon CR_4]|nr:MAG: hypothetical protein RBG13Loki_1281 [Candidatus Lokiarchaeota archaeon CR_4]